MRVLPYAEDRTNDHGYQCACPHVQVHPPADD
jgi:hypothetical protein